MALYNTERSYGIIAKGFHWIIALLVIFMIFLGFFMQDASGATKATVYTIHKSTGLTILFLMILRVCWRAGNQRPRLPKHMSNGLRRIAGFSHFLMYLVLIAMPLSGWIYSTAAGYAPNFWWLVKIPAPWVHLNRHLAHTAEEIHIVLAWVLVALAAIHIMAAIRHHWIKKDDVLRSMIPCHKSL
ncbi:MAG: cytochrome b [Gammaproteobacteria bacterium]|nr:cytochrome b [Gammaproteobacteria bacterium]